MESYIGGMIKLTVQQGRNEQREESDSAPHVQLPGCERTKSASLFGILREPSVQVMKHGA